MKISNPRMLAGNAALATQQYVNKASGVLTEYINDSITNLTGTTSAIISTVSTTLDTKIDSVSGAANEKFVQNTDLFVSYPVLSGTNPVIKPEYLPPISITDVIPVALEDIIAYGAADIKNNPKYYIESFLNAKYPNIQEGDIIIIAPKSYLDNVETENSNTFNENDYNYGEFQALVGPWIVTKPELDSTTTGIKVIKLTFPTTEFRTINNLAPDTNGNVTFKLDNLADYTSSQLSSLYMISYDDQLKRLATFTFGTMLDTKLYYATTGEVEYVSETVNEVSGQVITVAEKLNTVTEDSNNVSVNVNKISGDLDHVYDIFNTISGAFFTDSIEFNPTKDDSINSNVLKTKITIKTTCEEVTAFDMKLLKYSNVLSGMPTTAEIVAIYTIDNGKQESFYPDITIENDKYTVTTLVISKSELPEKIKVVYSNYKEVMKTVP